MSDALIPDTNTTDVRMVATRLERARRVWGVNEFIKPLRDHPAVKGTELEHDLDVMHAIVRSQAVLLCLLHRAAEDVTYAAEFLGVQPKPDRVAKQIKNLNSINRLAFAIQSNFCIEWILQHIATELFNQKPNPSFSSLVKQICYVYGRYGTTQHNRGLHKHSSEFFLFERRIVSF